MAAARRCRQITVFGTRTAKSVSCSSPRASGPSDGIPRGHRARAGTSRQVHRLRQAGGTMGRNPERHFGAPAAARPRHPR
jgi:hypothetical protein